MRKSNFKKRNVERVLSGHEHNSSSPVLKKAEPTIFFFQKIVTQKSKNVTVLSVKNAFPAIARRYVVG